MARLCGLGLLLLGIVTIYGTVLVDRPMMPAMLLATVALGMIAMGGVMILEGGRQG